MSGKENCHNNNSDSEARHRVVLKSFVGKFKN